MPKIQVVNEINKTFSIVKELRKRSFLKKEGSLFYGRCPWCGMYGLVVSDPQNIYYCFSCKEGGSSASYIMQRDNLLLKELSMLLKKNDDIYNHALEKGRRVVRTLAFAQKFFTEELRERGSRYGKYIQGRGLSFKEVGEWGIGCINDGGLFLHEANHKGFSQLDLMDAGLINSHGYPFFQNRIIFPLRNEHGMIIGFTGRSLDNDPKYLNSPTSPLYNKSSFFYGIDLAHKHMKEHNTVVIVEGQMDTIAMHQHDIRFTVGVSGTAFTEDHIKILHRIIPGGKVILMFDNDDAGRKATLRAGEMLKGAFEISVSFSKLGKDSSDHFRDGGGIKDFTTITYQDFILGIQTINETQESTT